MPSAIRPSRVAPARVRPVSYHHADPVGSQNFDGGGHGGLRERMSVGPQEQRPCDPATGPEVDDGLANGGYVSLVEGSLDAGTAVPRRPEGHRLGARELRIWPSTTCVGRENVVRRYEAGDVDKRRRRRWSPGQWVSAHGTLLRA